MNHLVARRRNSCAVSPALDAAGCVLILDERTGAPSYCVLASDPDGSATPRHQFSDGPLVRTVATALLLSACSFVVGETPTQSVAVQATTTPSTTGTTVRSCVHVTGDGAPVSTGSVAGDALSLSGELFLCANDVVVVGEADLNEVAAAAQLAAALGGPLLHPHPQLAAELGRLKPQRVHLVGAAVDVVTPPTAEVLRPTISEAVESARSALGVSEEVLLPVVPDASTVVQTVSAITTRAGVVRPQSDPSVSTTVPVAPTVDSAALIAELAQQTGTNLVWLIDAAQPVAILSAAATGRVAGATVVAYDPANILGHPEIGPALADRGAIRYVGTVPEASEWEIALLSSGTQVPGGGFHVFPEGQPRRYVAFYGHPRTTGLGALGEQGAQATVDRMAPFVADYGADGSQVIPTFEIIATVASATATEDNDYSFEWPGDSFAEWVAVAEENDMYVILDLQSGRDDFLTQAKQYEELLRLPFVGLALDPEWRLQSDQTHLNQVGRVEASEVNTVVDWLADLVRDNGLPQKMLVIHQFQSRMIGDRETLKQRPELQMVIQMDGQGPIPTKDETYRFLTEGTEDAHWRWGWKNFFDEDSPATATPEYTIRKDPVPVFVSYQ